MYIVLSFWQSCHIFVFIVFRHMCLRKWAPKKILKNLTKAINGVSSIFEEAISEWPKTGGMKDIFIAYVNRRDVLQRMNYNQMYFHNRLLHIQLAHFINMQTEKRRFPPKFFLKSHQKNTFIETERECERSARALKVDHQQ